MSGKTGYDIETAVASQNADGQNSGYREKNGKKKQKIQKESEIILVLLNTLCSCVGGIKCYNSSSVTD